MRTTRGLNDREHHMARYRRVSQEKQFVRWALVEAFGVRAVWHFPLVCLLTRGAPSAGLDDDNLAGALKGVRDACAEFLGVNDKCRDVVAYQYAQERSNRSWWVRIELMRGAV